jgi:hypothetical protein
MEKKKYIDEANGLNYARFEHRDRSFPHLLNVGAAQKHSEPPISTTLGATEVLPVLAPDSI